MESANNKQDEKAQNEEATDQTNPSTDSETKSVANPKQNNEVQAKKNETGESDQDDYEKIKLVFDDDDDEDIPGDFFDDFLKEDFMAGLDIVDDDDWNEDDKSVSASKPNHKPAPKQSPMKPKKAKYNEENNDKGKRGSEATESNEYDVRRDPKKTRRDIERDKERCEKDKEKKIISEKLQLVETGLVPPGTEMEIDMEEIKKQKKDLDHKVKNPVKSLSKSPKRKRISPSPRDGKNSKKLSPRRKRTPLRKVGELRKTSPLPKTSPRHRISPKTTSPLLPRDDRTLRRSRSPYPRRNRFSPTTTDRRRISPRRRSSDRRRSSERGPYSRRRRSRTRSPKRRRGEKKKSFLQEIAEKLNETRPMMVQPMMMGPMSQMMPPPYHQEMHYMPEPMHMPPNQMMPNPMMHAPVPATIPIVPAPVPAPVPPPTVNMYKPPEQVYDPFDQSFFIGNPAQQTPVQNSPAEKSPLPKATQAQKTTPATNTVNAKMPAPAPNKNKGDLSELTKTIIDKLNKTTDDIPKLFQDKKISLSEFLAITAKPEVVASSPANLKEKIKVISRCQDAISYLGTTDKKFSGRLVIRKTKKPSEKETDKYRSPLLAKQPKILFTDIPSRSEIESSFSSYINRLLRHIGIMDDVAVDVENYSEKNEAKTAPAASNETPPAPPPPPQISKSKKSSGSESARKKESPKAARGDSSRCSECERRAKKMFKSAGVQCSQDSIKYSVSTQFPEEDHSMKFPKNQSLAALTPAQLLANSVPTTSRFKDEFDLYGRGRGMPLMQSNDLNYRPRYQPFF